MTNDYGNLELHKVLLAAMKDIDKICRENGLRYYLYAGTLLGAINHKGFIPWDDDVDIVMMPDDFQRFCEIIKNKYSAYYEMQTFDTDENWYSKMNKLLVKGTEVFSEYESTSHPIFVDVQVLHSVPNRQWQRFIQRKQIEFINLILSTQSGAVIPTSFRAKIFLGGFAKLSKQFLGKRLNKVLTRYDKRETEYLGIMCNTLTRNPYTGRNGYDTDLTKRIWHEEHKVILFEDTEFMTISDIETYLFYQFGPNCMEPYPEEKRITKHDVKSYKISPEVRKRVGL